MAQAQARRTTRRNGSHAGHPLVFLCLGVVIGLLIPKGIDWLKNRSAGDVNSDTAQATEPATNSPKFDFYTLLPDSEVIVPEQELTLRPGLEPLKPKTSEPESTTQTPAMPIVTASATETATTTAAENTPPTSVSTEPKTVYLLQAGSFKKKEDAENVRIKLLFLNLPVNVQEVESNGDTWHRIVVGPFSTLDEMSSARSSLVSNAIESIVLKRTE